MNRIFRTGIFLIQCVLAVSCLAQSPFTQDDFDSLIPRLYELNRKDPSLVIAESAPAVSFAGKHGSRRNRILLEAVRMPSQIPYMEKARFRGRVLELLGSAENSSFSHELVPVLRLAMADFYYHMGEIQQGFHEIGNGIEYINERTPDWIRYRILEQLYLLKRYAQLHQNALHELHQMSQLRGFEQPLHPVEFRLLMAHQYMLLENRRERDRILDEVSLLIRPDTGRYLVGMYWMQRAWASIADGRPNLAVKELKQAAQSLEGAGFPLLEADLCFMQCVLAQMNGDSWSNTEEMFEKAALLFRKANLQHRYAELLIQLMHPPFFRSITDVPDAFLKALSGFAYDETNPLAYSEGLSAFAELLRRDGKEREGLEKLRLSHRSLSHLHKSIDFHLAELALHDPGKIFIQSRPPDVSVFYYVSLVVAILIVVLLFLFLKVWTQQHMNRQLAESVEKARIAEQAADASNRLKSQFLANVSHELKTPMSGLVGMASLLDELITDPLQRKYLSTIQTCCRNLLVLMEDLLDLGRMESGNLEVEKKEFSPREMISHSLDLVSEVPARKGLELKVDLSPELPGTLIGDPTRIGQILNNLLRNAIKFTPKGSVSLKADFEPTLSGAGNLVISVSDTGIGIPSKDLHTLFEPFNRLNTHGAVDSDGSGLGLAICRKLAELMNGSISVRSEPGEGSCFTVMIPARIPNSGRND